MVPFPIGFIIIQRIILLFEFLSPKIYVSTVLHQALTPPIRLYPPNAGPILPGMLGPAALGAQANVAAVAAGASAAAIQAAYDSSSKPFMYS